MNTFWDAYKCEFPSLARLGGHDSAFQYFAWILRLNSLRVRATHLESKGRHKIFECVSDDECFNFYVVFKRDSFHSFNFEFPDFVKKCPEYAGHGESLNVEYVDVAIRKDCVLVFIYENGRAYFVYPKLVKRFCVEHKLYRSQKREFSYKKPDYTKKLVPESEQTYSFPLCLLIPFETYFGC